jgi:Transposase DDE domain
VDYGYFGQLDEQGGYFIVRGGKSLDPTLLEAFNGQGRRLPTLANKKLKEVNRRTQRSEVIDLTVRCGNYVFRVVRCWFAEEKRFCLWLTNLPREGYSADDVMSIYRCRWQIELLFKELKSDTNWRRFATAQKAIVDGLVWASLLALIIRRSLAWQALASVSLYKAAKNVDVWFLPILEAYIHHAWSEITEKLDWALRYIGRNAWKSPQIKSRKNNALYGVYERLNA